MRFFSDHCVAESVCKFLESRGHEVMRLREYLPTDSPDPLVAKVAQESDAVLVSHDGDFKAIAPRVPKGAKQRFRRLSRIHMNVESNQALNRITAAIEFVEFEWDGAQQRDDKRLHIVVGKAVLKTSR